jgi:hypothetical protein
MLEARTPTRLGAVTTGNARVVCPCGGLLAESTTGRTFCLTCNDGGAAGPEWAFYRRSLLDYEQRRYDVKPRRKVLPYVLPNPA